MIRFTVHFTGHVQGVGFRYTAHNTAMGFPIAGYVQNLPDGRVLVVAEGAEEQVQAYLDRLCEHLERFIRAKTIDRSPATGEFTGRFIIRH